MAHEKILVVDDSSTTRNLLSDILNSAGYEVAQASDGQEAVDLVDDEQFDLVITDINMPRLDGLELLNRLNTRFNDLSVIIITGYANLGSVRTALVGGASDYISKPFKHEDILYSVRQTLARSFASRENSRLKDTDGLLDVSQTIVSSENYDSANRTIVASALAQTHLSRGAMLEHVRGKYQLRVLVDLQNPDAAHPDIEWEQFPVVQMLIKQHSPVLISKNKKRQLSPEIIGIEYMQDFCPEIFPFETEAAFFPLHSDGQFLGFFMFSKRESEPAFTASDIQLLSIISNQAAIATYNSQLHHDLQENYLNTIMSLNLILEAKHAYTQGHSRRVANLCVLIGRQMGLNPDELEILKRGAMLHDIGKTSISDTILNKSGSLTQKEIEIIRKHPVVGDEIIKPIEFLAPARSIIRNHHEWVNGQGWPNGLSMDQLSILDRICSVADAVDAMASDRSYRKLLPASKIRRELLNHAGIQFDPDVVEVAFRFVTRSTLKALDKPLEF